jgi:hypothetical protein
MLQVALGNKYAPPNPNAQMHGRMEGTQMAYPEPIPALEAKEAKEFEKRLSCFTLSAEQKRFYKEARERFKEKD